ncbi:MAG: hypothetical protein ABI995_06860, partial [Acidobacteriota bacterium]
IAWGNIVVRGNDAAQISVTLRQRVRAASVDEANIQWGRVARIDTPVLPVGSTLHLQLAAPGNSRVTTSFEVSVPKRLAVWLRNNTSGSVELYDLDESVEVNGGGALAMDRIRGDVIARTTYGGIRIGVVSGNLQCVSGGGNISIENVQKEANCLTVGGDVNVKYVGGKLTAITEGGNILVEKAGSQVLARSGAGLIDVREARGAVNADTRGGSILVGSANGLRAESADGQIRVRGGSGPMSVSTMVGSILAELMSGGRMQDSTLAAGTGDITLMIPAGMGLAVRARNHSGMTPRIVSDFPEIQVRSVGFRSPVTGQGQIAGGGPTIDLNTNGGTIYLRRSK